MLELITALCEFAKPVTIYLVEEECKDNNETQTKMQMHRTMSVMQWLQQEPWALETYIFFMVPMG